MVIIKIKSDFIHIVKNNSTTMDDSTKEVLDNFVIF